MAKGMGGFVKKSTALRNGKLRQGCKTVKTPSGTRYTCGLVTAKVKKARAQMRKQKAASSGTPSKCERTFRRKRDGAKVCVFTTRGKQRLATI